MYKPRQTWCINLFQRYCFFITNHKKQFDFLGKLNQKDGDSQVTTANGLLKPSTSQ
jgi:hypothetical protein